MRIAPDLLTPADAHWYRMEARRTPADIVSLMLLEGAIDEPRIRAAIERTLATRPRFRRRVVESRLGLLPPRWEDEPRFRLEDHFIRTTLEPPGDEAAVDRLLHRIASDALDFAHSPWRVWAVDGVLGGSALVSHLHHCLADGFALLSILLSMTDSPPAPPAAGPAPPRPLLRTAESIGAALGHLLFMPFDPTTSLHATPTGEPRLAWTRKYALKQIQEVAHARGATVNDAILSALTGALRRYLVDRGETPARMRGVVPVNLRPPGEPVDEEHGNRFGLVWVELPVDALDGEERVTILKREMDRIKSSSEAVVALGIMNALGRAPAIVDHVADGLFARKGSLVITNVPGPKQPLSIGGRLIKDMFFFVPHPWLGCGISIMSYTGHLRVGVRSDAAVVPEPAKIVAAFEQEMADWMPGDRPSFTMPSEAAAPPA